MNSRAVPVPFHFLLAALLLLLPGRTARAEDPATPKPSPIAQPSPAATPSAAPGVPSPAATPATTATAAAANPTPIATPAAPKATPTPTQRALLDSLTQPELQEAIALLKANYIHPERLTDEELSRAILQGVLDRLKGGAVLAAASAAGAPVEVEPNPFFAEILDERVGYLRMGSLNTANLQQLDASLDNFNAKNLKAVVLDLRATPQSADMDQALEVIRRFAPKGKLLFTLKRPSEKQERIFTSNQEPKYKGLLMVLADGESSGASEVIAAALRNNAGAMVVGETTAGQAVEFSERKLGSGQTLRFAVAEVVLPESGPLFPEGVKPDLVVAMDPKMKRQILKASLDKGVSQFVFDKERPRMNEASLVSGATPELDAYQASQRGSEPDAASSTLRDVVLQRAIDLITSITIYQTKPGKG